MTKEERAQPGASLHTCTFINRCLPASTLVCHASYDHRRLHAEASSPFQVPKRKREIHEANWHPFLSLTKYVHICTYISCICALLISTHACIPWRHSFPFITGMFQPKNKVVMIGPHSCLCTACTIGSPFRK